MSSKLFVVEVAIVVKAPCWQSCNSLLEPQTTMLQVHHKDDNTCKNQSSWLAQSLKQTFLHKLLNLTTFFTNYFYSKPFSQIGFVSDLSHKLVLFQTFLTNWLGFGPSLQKTFTLITFTLLKKNTRYKRKLLWSWIKEQFWVCSCFFCL